MFASIDVGSNSLRMLVGEVVSGKVFPVDYYREITRLGGNLSELKGLASDSMERTLFSLHSFQKVLKDNNIKVVRAVGTQALRRAVNGSEFCNRVYAETGITIEIISGEEEAELSALGALSILDSNNGAALDKRILLDIGGGSTEVVLWNRGQVQQASSYPLGAVSLHEKIMSLGLDCNYFGFKNLMTPYLESIQSDFSSITAQCTLAGTAGTITTVAAYDLAMDNYDWRRINNHRMTIDRLRNIYQEVLPLSDTEREKLPGIEKGRGDIIISGLSILIAIMECFNMREIVVSDFGLLEGVLLNLAD